MRSRRKPKPDPYASLQAALMAVNENLYAYPLTVKHVIKHEPRPPSPRPYRMTVVYQMPDGSEYKEYVPLNGQATWHMNLPHFVEQQIRNNDQVTVRYDFGYEDGSR